MTTHDIAQHILSDPLALDQIRREIGDSVFLDRIERAGMTVLHPGQLIIPLKRIAILRERIAEARDELRRLDSELGGLES